ncbi:histidine kinase [Streptomyces venezuelae]|uniref:sensor histidine kinase n=1 Tax=Streptomyces gardneri TaxID=66892 RepID=UPI0007230CEB|nr:histidine kinase [Streptomyces gardneri]ALO09635.1 histidine kinase [Streptomyces venezuelae]QPK50622.1 sensor histidine kinase [Streptomyces gardneri]WRK42052.1 histidine kinase [Streptomyces venezuelae]
MSKSGDRGASGSESGKEPGAGAGIRRTIGDRAAAWWGWFVVPGQWSRRRTAGEISLAVVLALLAAGSEELLGGEGRRLVVVAVGAAVLSLLRRRLPASVLVLAAGLSPFLPGFGPLLIVVGWSAGRYVESAGRALAAFMAAFVLNVGGTLLETWDRQRLLTMAFLAALYYLGTTLAPGLAHRYWTQRRTLLHALQERNAQLLRERTMVAWQARLRERQRIAQDMHDSLGHQLALIAVHTGALEVDRELSERQREVVGVLRNASVTAMHELREVVGILRDGIEATEGPGSAPARAGDETGKAARGTAGIEGLVAAARAAGTTVGLRRLGEERPLAPAADHAAYRIVQEALTNAYKYAPGAPIAVELRYEPDTFVVEVLNEASADGPAKDVVSGGQGLTGLAERARLVGGMCHAGPADGGGFRVAGMLPYGAAPVAEAAPLVDAADDFRQQSTRPLVGDGRPVAVGSADWTFTERELAMAMRGGKGRGMGAGGGVALGCGIAFAAVVLLVVAAGFGLYFMIGSLEKGMIDPKEYDAVKVGTAEREVRNQLPSGDSIATAGLGGKGPARPEGADCLVLLSTETGESFAEEPVFRFCFKDGKLIEKKSYVVEQR